MAFSYKPLWKLLIDKNINKKSLMQLTGISKSTMDKMYREKYVALSVIDRICESLDCEVSDVIAHKKVVE